MQEENRKEESGIQELPDGSSFSFHFAENNNRQTGQETGGANTPPKIRHTNKDPTAPKKSNDPTERKQKEKKHRYKLRARSAKAESEKKAEQAEKTFTAFVKKNVEEWTKTAATSTLAIVGAILLILLLLIGLLVFMIFSNTSSGIMAGSYQSRPAELDSVDARLTEKELELQRTIDNIESDHPGFDEYHYNLDPIGHDPFILINYLSAGNGSFTAADAETEISSLFEAMYTLILTETEENRTRTVADEETGEEKEEEYTVTILEVKLESKDLETIVRSRLNADALQLYDTYGRTKGALQVFYTPLDLDWQSLISSYYGHRKNPRNHQDQFHRGVDIAVAEGTEVYAAQDGTVTVAGNDPEYGSYIVIENAAGYVSKYAHLSQVSVSAGDTVTHGQIIGKTGSTGSVTGSHLHLECLYRGEYYNPLFYFRNGSGALYGTNVPVSGSANAVIHEAQRYLDYPYVWGGSNPSTSFDCSGFVCWSFTNSGACNLPRTTAQGIYNRSRRISASEARPGDLVFFTGTYSSGNPVTHVGIYLGDGRMIHAGSPIKISPITTPYWQNHLYGFGRLLE